MSIEQIAFEFLRSLSGNCPEEIVDYLVFLFECDEKPDQSLLEDSLVGSVPEFAFLSEKDRKAALQDLISQVESFKFSKLSLSSTVSSPKVCNGAEELWPLNTKSIAYVFLTFVMLRCQLCLVRPKRQVRSSRRQCARHRRRTRKARALTDRQVPGMLLPAAFQILHTHQPAVIL